MTQHNRPKNTQEQNKHWQQLEQLASAKYQLVDLFKQEPKRGNGYCAKACGLYLDYSKQLLDMSVLHHLLALANAYQLGDKIQQLQQGGQVNPTEHRPALHTALRLPPQARLMLHGQDVNAAVQASLTKAEQIVEKIRQKVWRGFSGKAITDVVNIGVGGSDLGPVMAVTALDEWADTDVRVHFISNMDGTQLAKLLNALKPQTTLFIISSKSFTTSDTFSNADTAMAWLQESCTNKAVLLKNHFIAVSANTEKMDAWGIVKGNQLEFWEWVGGRFSLWSVIGLAIAIKIGMANFRELLTGAHAMDNHFATADLNDNLPALLGLIGVWNSTFLRINAHTVLPYDGRLRYFPNYLMQLEMESNGKSVNLSGQKVNYNTAPVMWGDVGSNAQHAFYQLLHQGTQQVSCDFIAPIKRYHDYDKTDESIDTSLQKQHHLVLANCLAQSRVLAFGNAAVATADNHTDNQHKNYRGNQPSTTILLDELSPYTLGALTALYEHKVFVMSVIWQINPFDQWGVEVGKVMANDVYQLITEKLPPRLDSSTNALLKIIASDDNLC